MIILDDKEMAFIHVPKCAGSTVRHQLLEFSNQEDTFKGPAILPDLGKVHLPHLTLDQVRSAFPEAFRKIGSYETFAITRDPISRFASALGQRLKQHKGVNIHTMDEHSKRREMEVVFDVLAANDGALPSEFIHFTRQSAFIELEGKQIVKHLFPMAKVSELVSVFAEKFGRAHVNPGRHNQSLEFRHDGLRDAAMKLNRSLKRLVPRSVYVQLKTAATPLLTKKPSAGSKRLPFTNAEIRLIEQYYAADFKYQQISKNRIKRRDEENA
ncbi:sulfotransferase family protein [Roseobacter sp. YSTF-M11]|uniref:Sulfotransferase family protein n=1 Tax=Roseobacter insulae TaxID=2859783 RepID=A0A9X1FVT2_9RHOB|nr:sulfotransferase family 2 domain-containing protein [Roseobacter insulae]MBW4708547.1 sulfotransferase family protein [Roseobacter insulae]